MNALSENRRAVPRRLVLAAAALAGIVALAVLPPTSPPLVAEAAAQAAPSAPSAAPAEPPDSGSAPKAGRGIDAEITIDHRGVTVQKGGKGGEARVHVGDMEFESFEQFMQQAPWIAAMVVFVTALVFLTPLLLIALVIWYKVRRTRMMNETMLKLAERGVVPPAEAMAALASGRVGPALQNVPASAPLYEQAKAIRKREAWSDLRKGVLIGGVGLGLTFWSMLDDGSANGFGLILLFVGIGYTILWYLEDRRFADRPDRSPPAGGA